MSESCYLRALQGPQGLPEALLGRWTRGEQAGTGFGTGPLGAGGPGFPRETSPPGALPTWHAVSAGFPAGSEESRPRHRAICKGCMVRNRALTRPHPHPTSGTVLPSMVRRGQ